MPRYRTIECQVWNDDKFPFCGDDLQLIWFHLKTTPFSTPLGIFYAPIAGLAAEKRWSEERYRKRLREGSDKGFWKVDERFNVVYFPKYFKHNKPDNPNVLRGWLKCWNEIPECGLKNECYQQLEVSCKEWGNAYLEVLETLPKPSGNVPETVTVTVTGTVPVKEKTKSLLSMFDLFWSAYPRKQAKEKAMKAFRKISPSEELLRSMLERIEKAKKSTEWKDPTYIPYAATWLNGKRWEDELRSVKQNRDIIGQYKPTDKSNGVREIEKLAEDDRSGIEWNDEMWKLIVKKHGIECTLKYIKQNNLEWPTEETLRGLIRDERILQRS